jgi:GMP synthase PP-ATPase subunit
MVRILQSLSFWETVLLVLTPTVSSARIAIIAKDVMGLNLLSIQMELALYRHQEVQEILETAVSEIIVQETEVRQVGRVPIVEVAWQLGWELEEGSWQLAWWQ